jgi:hypothetical protein
VHNSIGDSVGERRPTWNYNNHVLKSKRVIEDSAKLRGICLGCGSRQSYAALECSAVSNILVFIDRKELLLVTMQPTPPNNNKMTEPLLLTFSTSLEMTDSLFTVPSQDVLSELLRTLPSLATNEIYASYSSKEERKANCGFSFLEVEVLTPMYSARGLGTHGGHHHFDPDEKKTLLGKDSINWQPCPLEITSKSSKCKTCAPKALLTRVSSFAA